MNQNDELPIRAWWTTSESSAHLSFSKPYTQGVYSEPEALVLLSDAQRIRNERDRLRAENERLTSAIRWALGYDEGEPQFGEQPEQAGRYAWRTELRRRAALAGEKT